jgi:hypothetical protein
MVRSKEITLLLDENIQGFFTRELWIFYYKQPSYQKKLVIKRCRKMFTFLATKKISSVHNNNIRTTVVITRSWAIGSRQKCSFTEIFYWMFFYDCTEFDKSTDLFINLWHFKSMTNVRFWPTFASFYSIDFATFLPIQNEFYKKLSSESHYDSPLTKYFNTI